MKYPATNTYSAFSLIEVTLAIGVVAFAMLAIIGLLPVGINNNRTSIAQTAVTDLATGVLSDLRQTRRTDTTSPKYGININTGSTVYLDENGALQPVTAARYKVVVSLTKPPAGPTAKTATNGSVIVSWPAPAATPAGSLSVFVALDRN